jgi:LPXTG-motif cell wall-anchored protein
MTLTDTLTRRVALAAVSGGLVALAPFAAPVASASGEYPAPTVTPSPAPTVAPTVAGTQATVPKPGVAPAGALPAAGMDSTTEALALVGGALAGAGVITLVLRRRRAHS